MRLTQAQFDSYNERRMAESAVRRPVPTEAQTTPNEKDLHNKILDYCRVRQWIVFHGSMAHATHRTPGEPDFIILCPRGVTFLIECKSRSGKLTTDQLGIMAWAEKLQHTIHIIRSYTEFLDLLNGMDGRPANI
jgi:hypothetical protein